MHFLHSLFLVPGFSRPSHFAISLNGACGKQRHYTYKYKYKLMLYTYTIHHTAIHTSLSYSYSYTTSLPEVSISLLLLVLVAEGNLYYTVEFVGLKNVGLIFNVKGYLPTPNRRCDSTFCVFNHRFNSRRPMNSHVENQSEKARIATVCNLACHVAGKILRKETICLHLHSL
jgi:hypothetical protein